MSHKINHFSDIVPMPKATPENYKVCILRLSDYDSSKFIFNDVIKSFFMFADVRLVSPDPNPDLADGEIPVFDMKGVSIWHLFKISLSTLKLYFKYVQEVREVNGPHGMLFNYFYFQSTGTSRSCTAMSCCKLHTALNSHYVFNPASFET